MSRPFSCSPYCAAGSREIRGPRKSLPLLPPLTSYSFFSLSFPFFWEGRLPPPSSRAICFVHATAASGISFRHHSGAFGKKYLPETMGSGVCVLDYDNDGFREILFVNSMDCR